MGERVRRGEGDGGGSKEGRREGRKQWFWSILYSEASLIRK